MPADAPTGEKLPPLYDRWLGDLLGGPIPAETRAPCSACVMLLPDGAAAAPDETWFDPRVKCCSYMPELPNFLVGRILADADPALARGRASVEERMASRRAVTPLGLGHTEEFKQRYAEGRPSFGQLVALRCPHYLEAEGQCGIWRHRNSVCSTWFCRYVRGASGRVFWRWMRLLLEAVERGLASWCAVRLDVGEDAMARLASIPPLPPDLDGHADPDGYRALWGRFAGDERRFYEECARLVEPLAWDEAVAACGPEVMQFERLVRDRYAAYVAPSRLPARLAPGEIEARAAGPDLLRVVAYNAYDPQLLPRRLVDGLRHFLGGVAPVEARARLAAEGVALDDELLARLVDFEVLVPPERLARRR